MFPPNMGRFVEVVIWSWGYKKRYIFSIYYTRKKLPTAAFFSRPSGVGGMNMCEYGIIRTDRQTFGKGIRTDRQTFIWLYSQINIL